MKRLQLAFLFLMLCSTQAFGQIVNDIPPNEPNDRFLNDPSTISMRPGLSIAGFSNDGAHGLGLQQILNKACESQANPEHKTVSQILGKARESTSLNPGIGQVEATTNKLQYLAFETLASFILEQNGISDQQFDQACHLDIRKHSTSVSLLKTVFKSLTQNDKLVRKLPDNEPFDDYLISIRSYNNMARAIDLYLALENAYQFFGGNEALLLNESEKIALMSRFKADVDLLYNQGLKQEYSLSGNSLTVTADKLEAGNRPLKGYLAIGYASMSVQTTDNAAQQRIENYSTEAITRASESFEEGSRDNYWMYQTNNGSRFWAEGPYYLDFVLKDAIIFWHAVRINQNLESSFDPFYNDWFLNPVRWLAELSTPDGSTLPLDDGNKRPIQSANLLRWSGIYGDEEIGKIYTSIQKNVSQYHEMTRLEDQYFLVEASIPTNSNASSEVQSVTDPEEQQLILRHTDSQQNKHFIALNGETEGAITSGEGHEQPDQLQLLYYQDQFSFIVDPGYDTGNPQANSTWNGYRHTNTMQYNSSDVQSSLDFVIYQNEGGLQSPFASFVEKRKVSVHNGSELHYEQTAPMLESISGEVELEFQNPLPASSTYHRTVLFVKGNHPYLIDLNDIISENGRNDFVMRYHGNSDEVDTHNGWFYWNYSDQPFTSPSDRLFIYTAPLVGSYTEENATIEIQEYENRDSDLDKQAYPIVRKSYVSNEETDRFTTATFLSIQSSLPDAEPLFITDSQNLKIIVNSIDSETVDLFVFSPDSVNRKRTITIDSGILNGLDFSLPAHETIGFSRLRNNDGTWTQDTDYSMNLNAITAPDPPTNLTVTIEEQSSGPAAVLTWDAPSGSSIEYYEVWKQIRNRSDQTEEPASLIATPQTTEFADISITDPALEEFEQRWFVKAINSDSLASESSNRTEWIYFEESTNPSEFKLFYPYPNPMQQQGYLKYQVAEEADITIQVFDMLGREVITLFQDTRTPGIYTLDWKSNNIASGMYILQLTAESGTNIIFQKSALVTVIK